MRRGIIQILFLIPFFEKDFKKRFPDLNIGAHTENIVYDFVFIGKWKRRNLFRSLLSLFLPFLLIREIFRAMRYDVVFIYREIIPSFPPIFEWLLSKTCDVILYIDEEFSIIESLSLKKKSLFPTKHEIILKLSDYILLENYSSKDLPRVNGKYIPFFTTAEDKQKPFSVLLKIIEENILGKGTQIKKRIKLLHLITDLDMGGTPIVLKSLVTNLNTDKYELFVCSLKRRNDAFIANKMEEKGIPVYFLNAHELQGIFAVYRLYKWLKRENFDLLHSWLFHANIFGRIAGRLAKVPLIISSERTLDRDKSTFRVLMDRLTNQYTDIFIANSEAVKQILVDREKILPAKISIIPNGIDINKFSKRESNINLKKALGIDRDDKVVTMIARFDPVKGHLYLLRAIPQVTKKIPNVKFLIVGEGYMERYIRREIKKLQIQSQVILPGVYYNVEDILSFSDLFVLPSLEEGMPGSVLEAMAMELPVVATNVGGIPEVIKNGETGYLVSPRSPEELQNGLIELLQDAERAREIGKRARKRVESDFTLHMMLKKTEEIYETLIAEKINLNYTKSCRMSAL